MKHEKSGKRVLPLPTWKTAKIPEESGVSWASKPLGIGGKIHIPDNKMGGMRGRGHYDEKEFADY